MQRWHVTIRDTLVVLLTLTTGAVDAASFLALGQVFSSVITGNLVLLGIAAGTSRAALAVHSGVALAGYSVGVALGAPIAARRHHGEGESRDAGPGQSTSTWPPSVTLTLIAELCVLAGFTVWWEAVAGKPQGNLQLGLVVLLGAAMGMQSAAIRRLGQMSTTYLTSTLTGVVAGLATRSRPDALPRSIGVLAAIVIGAVLGAVMVKTVPELVPLVMLLPLCTVIGASVAGFRWVREHVLGSRALPGPGR
jgi:uncharacterized membrane protein YoaK (UPF0700 family)